FKHAEIKRLATFRRSVTNHLAALLHSFPHLSGRKEDIMWAAFGAVTVIKRRGAVRLQALPELEFFTLCVVDGQKEILGPISQDARKTRLVFGFLPRKIKAVLQNLARVVEAARVGVNLGPAV